MHRLPVFDDEGNIVNIISQSGTAPRLTPRSLKLSRSKHQTNTQTPDVIAWYAKNMGKLPELCQRTVSHVRRPRVPTFSRIIVIATTTTIIAFIFIS